MSKGSSTETAEDPARPAKPPWVRRVAIGLGAIGIAVLWAALWVGIALDQSRQVRVEATVAARSCHDSDPGPDGAGGGTTCVVTLDYTAPDGTPGEVVFHGVDATRIHNRNGQDTVYIYFADTSSETAINPQDNVPLWATVLLVSFSLPVAIGAFVYILLGFRRPKPVHQRLVGSPAPYDQDRMI